MNLQTDESPKGSEKNVIERSAKRRAGLMEMLDARWRREEEEEVSGE